MASTPAATQLRKGVLEHCVLALLRGGERYGYDLVTELAEAGLLASEGTIYPLLSRLRKEELVESSWRESPSGPPRRYYSITAQGEHALADFRTAWTGFRNSVDVILSGKDPR